MSWLKNQKCCAVPGCSTDSKDPTSRFKFPKNQKWGTKWLEAIKSEELSCIPYNHLEKLCVCSHHFDAKYIITTRHNKSRLNQDSIPTLHLPECFVPWVRPTEGIQKDSLHNEETEKNMDCETTESVMNLETVGQKPLASTCDAAKEPREKSSYKNPEKDVLSSPRILNSGLLEKKMDFLNSGEKRVNADPATKMANVKNMQLQNGLKSALKIHSFISTVRLQQEKRKLLELHNELSEHQIELFRQNEKLFEQLEKLFEQNEKLSEYLEKLFKQNEKLSEEDEKRSEQIEKCIIQNEKLSEQFEKLFEENEKLSEQFEKRIKQNEKLSEQIEKRIKQNEVRRQRELRVKKSLAKCRKWKKRQESSVKTWKNFTPAQKLFLVQMISKKRNCNPICNFLKESTKVTTTTPHSAVFL